jgi:hypothetical protein
MDPALFEGLFTEILAPLINGTLSKLSDSAKVQWRKVGDKQAAKAYKAKLIKRYSTIQILGQPRPQKLSKVYTNVYLHEKPTHSYAMGVEKLEEMFLKHGNRFGMGDTQSERLDGLGFAKEHERLFILGKPGAGKTTFLKYLTMQAADGDLPFIPIFVSLNNFQHQKVELLDYLAEQFDVCDFPEAGPFIEQLLKKGKGLILFDGLDEVSKEDNQRTQITHQLKQFMTKYDSNRFAITCRIAASDYQFQNFAYVEMADFTNKQVETFVRRWFAESKPKIDGFLKEIEGNRNKGIKEMTTSPLLLTLLCIQYNGSMALPPSRSEVYEEALEVLLKTWDGHRDINRGDLIVENEDRYKALTFKRKTQLMSRLAWGTFKEGKLFIEQKLLEDKIVNYIGKIPKGPDPDLVDGGVVLKAMESQHGLLVERATRIYSFSHLTLQEYFTAKYIVDYAKGREALSGLVGRDKMTDPRWREVFLFVAELLPTGDELVVWMAETLQEMAAVGEVKTLVAWAEKRSFERPFACQQRASRIGFLTCALDRDLDLDRALASALGSASAFAFPRASARASAPDRASDRALASALGSASAFASARASARASALGRALGRAFDLGLDLYYIDFVESMGMAIMESEKLDWLTLTNALKNVSQPTKNSTREEWETTWHELNETETKIILDHWEWEVTEIEDVDRVTAWLNGHELLFDCLDRVVLEDLDRAEFEDDYLYRLPPHARPKLGGES